MPRIHPGRILYEDDHLLVVNKLEGELVVSAGKSDKLPLYDFLHKHYPGLRVVHRLDFGTSGVIVFAKTKEAMEKIRESKFAGWIKHYRTLVAGHMTVKQGTIERKLAARTADKLVDAVSAFKVLEAFPIASFVDVEIETGRKHQVRQHLKFIGHPLLLDPLYGNKKADEVFQKKFHYHRFFLHASSVDFPHPITGKHLHIEAPLPGSFEKVLRALRMKNMT